MISQYQVNGRVESLEMQLDELKIDLNNEKNEHSKTVTLLREALRDAESASRLIAQGNLFHSQLRPPNFLRVCL
jgi:hypothetical protein